MGMGKPIQIDLVFNTNVAQARQQMQQLQTQLSQLTAQPITGLSITPQIQQATQAAMQLKMALNNAVNVDTGRLNLNKFQAQLKQSGMTLQQYAGHLRSLGPAGVQAFAQMSTMIAQADTRMFALGTKTKSFITSLAHSAQYQLASSAIYGIINAFSKTISYAKELDTSLNNIRIVTGKGADEMARFAKEANNMAKQLSTSTTKFTDASLIYYQQGLNDNEVAKRTETTVKLANVVGKSAQEVSEWMTAIWNNYDDGSKELEYYADVLATLGAATASSADEIATGLEKFSAVANTVGLSYEYAASALATITAETRQSADVVGTALKTLFARIEGLKLGDTLEDGTTLNQYSLSLEKVGVNIKDANGELKDMDTILDQTGARWSTLAKDEQVALAQSVAGIRQYTQFMALMDNWDVMQRNLDLTEEASGALQTQQRIYEESAAAAKERLDAELDALKAIILGGDELTDVYSFFEGFVGVVVDLLEAFGGLDTILLGVAAALTKMYQPQIATMFANLGASASQAWSSMKNFATGKGFVADNSFQVSAVQLSRSMIANSADAGVMQSAFTQQNADLDMARIQNAHKLSEAEKQIVDWKIQNIKQDQQILLEQQAVLETEQKRLEVNSELMSKKVGGTMGVDPVDKAATTIGQTEAHGAYAMATMQQAATAGPLDMESRQSLGTGITSNLEAMKAKLSEVDINIDNLSFSAVEESLANFVSTGKGLDDLIAKMQKLNAEVSKRGDGAIAHAGVEARLRGADKTYDQISHASNLHDNSPVEQTSAALNKIDLRSNKISGADKNTIKNLRAEAQALQKRAKLVKTGQITQKQYNEEQVDFNKKVKAALKPMAQQNKRFRDNIKQGKQYKQSTKDNGKAMKDHGKAVRDNSKQLELNGIAAEQTGKKTKGLTVDIQKGQVAIQTMSTKLASGLQTMATVAMGFSMITSAATQMGKAIASGDMSLSNMVSSLASMSMGLVMVIPELAKASSWLWKHTAALDASILKTKMHTAAEKASMIIKKGLTLVTKLFTAETWKNIGAKMKDTAITVVNGIAHIGKAIAQNWVKGLAVAAAALPFLLLAGAMAVSAGAGASESEEEETSETVDKSIENMEAIDENQELAETVGNLTDEYQDLVNAGESTKDILEDMNEQIPELIESYKELINTLGADIDLTSLEKAYEYFKLTGNISPYEAEQAKVDAAIKTEELDNAKTGLASATKLMLSAATDSYGWEDGDNYTFDANSDEDDTAIENILKENFGDMGYGGDYGGDNVTFDKSDAGAWIEYYNTLGKTLTDLKEAGKENTATYEDMLEEYESLGEHMEDLRALSDTAFQLKKDELLELGTDAIGEKNIANIEQYRKERESLIKTLRDEYEWTEAQAKAYLKETDAFGRWEETIGAFGADTAERSAQATQIANKWGEDTLHAVENWYANLPDDDKTLFLGIDFSQVSGALNTVQLEKLIEEQREKMRIAAAQKEAVDLGADEETFKAYAQILQSTNDNLKDNEAGAYEVAAANFRVKKGLEDLNSTWDKSLKKIHNNTKGSYEYAEGLTEITKALQTVLGSDWIGVDFTSQHLDEIEAMLNGNYEMFEQLQDAAADYYVDAMVISDEALYGGENVVAQQTEDIQNALTNLLDSLGDQQIGVEMTLENEQYLNTLQAALDAGQITQEQLEEAFKLRGYDVNFKTHQVPGPSQHVKRTGEYRMGPVTIPYNIEYDESTTMTVPLIGDSKVSVQQDGSVGASSGTGTFKATRTADSTTAQNSFTKDNAKNNAKTKAALDDEIERYHEIDEIIEETERDMDALAEAKDRAFGANKLAIMEQEIAKQQQLVDLAKQRLAEAEAYYDKDLETISKYGVSIDVDGNISNYQELVQNLVDKMKGMSNTESDEYKETEEYLKQMKEDFSQYEETLDTVKEEQQNVINLQNAMSDLALEKIEYEIEFKVNLDEQELALLERIFARIEDNAYKAAESIVALGQSLNTTAKSIDYYSDGIDKILSENFTSDEIARIKAGNLDGIDLTVLDANEIEKIQEFSSSLLDVENQLRDLHNQVHDQLSAAFEQWNEDLDRNIEKFEQYNSVIDTIENIVDIVGQGRLGLDDTFMADLLSTRTSVSMDSLDAAKANKEAAQAVYDEYKAAYDNAVALYGEDSEIARKWKEQMDTAYEDLVEADNAFNETLGTTLENIVAEFEHAMESIVKTFEDNVAGIYGSLEELEQGFERQKEISERYLEDYEKTYEISKLNRKINQDLAKTTSAKSSKELRDLQKELLALNEKGTNVSKMEVDFMQKKYNLLLAEQALRDAQNAKSTVRLKRDSQGNYGYVYTANQNNVNQAQQAYEDAQYALESYVNDSYMTIQENIIQIYSDYSEAIQQINSDTTLSEEERKRKVEETQQYYTEKLKYWTDTAEMLSQRSYDANSQFHMDMADSIHDTIFSHIYPDVNDWDELYVTTSGHMGEMCNKISEAHGDMYEKIDEALYKAGTSMEDFKKDANREFKEVKTKSGETASAIKTMADDIKNKHLPAAVSAAQWFETNFNSHLQNVMTKIGDANSGLIKKMNDLAKAAKDALAAMQEADNYTYNSDPEELPGGDDNDGIPPVTDNHSDTTVGTYTVKLGTASEGARNSGYVKVLDVNTGKYVGYAHKDNIVSQIEDGRAEIYQDAQVYKYLVYKNGKVNTGWNGGVYFQSATGLGQSVAAQGAQTRDFWYNKNERYKSAWDTGADSFSKMNKIYIDDRPYYWGGGVGSSSAGVAFYPSSAFLLDPTRGTYQLILNSYGILAKYDTGGYTGSWGPEGRLAMLHQKEIVLNAHDTENLLSIISMVRDMSDRIELNARAMQYGLTAAYTANNIKSQNDTLQQEVHITAEFPNATNHSEIEEAFRNLSGQAAQFIHRQQSLTNI